MGDVVVVFRDQPGKVPEWVPEVVGVRSGDSVTWHPWPSDWLRSVELAVIAKTGGAVESATGQDGIVAAVVGDDLVTVLADPGKPSKVAAQNAELYEAEAAGQAIPDQEIDAISLTAAPLPAAIEAPPAGDTQSPQSQASAS
jgi:hypothetical protein